VYRWQEREGCPAHQPQRKEQTDKQERFEQAKALRLRGLSQKAIARRLAIGVRTVQRGPGRETSPASQPRRKRRSIFDPYAPYVLARWQQGCRDVSLLWQEIQEQGFPGSLHTMYRFVKALRQEAVSLPAPSVLDRVAVQKAIWLLARPYEKLKAHERTDLQELCQASPELAALYALVQAFGQMVRKRDGHRLPDWMKQVAESNFRDVKRFAEATRTGQRRSACRLNTGLFQRAGGRPDQQTQTHQKTRLWQSSISPASSTGTSCILVWLLGH
jgi:transposase